MNAIIAHLEKMSDFDTFDRKSNKGDTVAMHNLALLLSRGTGVAQDDVRAVELWKEASRRGHLESTYNLGEMLYHDRGVPVLEKGTPYFNQFKAVALWTQCTRRAEGHGDAERRLAEAYLSGVGVMSVDQAKAVHHLANATNKSVADAWTEIGEMHEKGTGGFVKNEAAAAHRYSFSAETGNAKAFFHLGKMYLDGRGVAKDKAKGQALVEASVEAGHAEAQYHQAILLAKKDAFKVRSTSVLVSIRENRQVGLEFMSFILD
jgi:TPR repeat protein